MKGQWVDIRIGDCMSRYFIPENYPEDLGRFGCTLEPIIEIPKAVVGSGE
jgi:hypothetical protein